ncbi:spermidine/putrescine transport system substrate-binding protein [Clostridium cavendishii DSM 21758]|uniref:Spermidine/putrescine transport system substrate-binding protein n=1 Tax=Clostridium cavendishii DSM 21758 TaxID=1121302 RepID=A0A1M6AGZ1_9CLOT|nr:spermidine/putrescine ABC transporter substrate-binding protein [Clostridium cavendishii]SHI35749.1 spermidine/putrescine transport system substrate-binding protein [Clostridium cavendishii DSM 21758]
MNKARKIISILCIVVITSSFFSGCSFLTGKGNTKVLNLYNWGDYLDPELKVKFEKETGIKVIEDTYETNEIMYQKLKSGNSDYDLIIPSDYMIQKMSKENLLSKINYNNVPNFKNIDEKFTDLPFDPKSQYSVPYMWGTVGIIYNKKTVKEPVDSWNILWNSKYKGQIIMTDSVRDAMAVSLKRLGYSINTKNENEITQAKEELIKQKPLVLAYIVDEVKDLMVREEASLAVVWSGDAVTMMERNENLAYAIPKEGTNKWFDGLCIPNGAKHKAEAEAFINFLLEPENAKQNVEYIGYSTSNKPAFDLLDNETKEDPVAYPSEEALQNSEVFVDLGDRLKIYDDAWLEIKSK